MSDREARRFDQLSDGHLADKAAYGDQGAFVALAERFHDPVWTVAALASSDAGTATRATARAFTRTLAGVAAGIGDPDACVERALVAAAFELAVTARVDEADLVAALPPALRALDPGTRVAVWLTGQGWAAADAVAVVTAADEPAPDLAAVAPAARDAAGALALDPPAGLAAATTDAWHEWQGIGLTIPDRHPLTAVLARLDAPLGRMGDALGRTARTARTTRRRRARAAAAATPPPPVLLPVGADESAADVSTTGADGTAADDAKPFGARIAAAAAAASTTGAATTSAADRPTATPEAATPETATPTPTPGLLDGPVEHDLDQLDRRGRPRPGHLVTAGSTPTRTRVLAALAAGILTASAMGSLLTSTPADGPTSGSEQVAAAEAPPDETQGSGDLLDDELVPVVDVDDTTTSTGATSAPGPTAGAPTAGPTAGGRGTTGGSGGDAGAPAPGRTPSTGGGGSGGGGAPVSPPGSGGSSGGGGGTGGGGSAPAPTQPPATTPPAPPTTSPPPPTTTPPPPTTTPPPTTDPGLVCGLLPVLCPGGGLVP